MAENFVTAVILTFLAGASTGLGGAIAFFVRQATPRFLAASLGFSAGVMLYVSFVEILDKSKENLQDLYEPQIASLAAVLAFFGGIALIALIDWLVPAYENPHEIHHIEDIGTQEHAVKYAGLLRMGLFTALAIAIHNFPEGLATFTASLSDPLLGLPIAVAIAIHNIPEGIAIFVPLYYATGSRKKAFLFSGLSGMAEPIGGLAGFALFQPFGVEIMFGFVFAAVAGIMVYISLDELLPTAEEYGRHHLAITSLLLGMAVMASSLVLFA